MSTAEEQKTATEMVAVNALAHPLWGQDAHEKALKDAGFDKKLRRSLSRAIGEAILLSQSLILEQAEKDGWEKATSPEGDVLWTDPDTQLCWETQSVIKEYLARVDGP